MPRTQIGGKYDQADLSLFALKRTMVDAGIDVACPASEGIVCTIAGRGYTFDPRTVSFYEVETDYYHSIATSDFHTVNDRFLSVAGYIGASAALEMTYAMLHNKPILLMYPPVLAETVDPACADIIQDRIGMLHIHDLTTMRREEIASLGNSLAEQQPDYGLDKYAGEVIMAQVDRLFLEIQQAPLHVEE